MSKSQIAGSLSETGNMQFANFFLFLWLLRCFTSPGLLHYPMDSDNDVLIFHQDGFPHSDISGSQVACHLTEAFRRLLRPSSSFDVEASTICPWLYLTTRIETQAGRFLGVCQYAPTGFGRMSIRPYWPLATILTMGVLQYAPTLRCTFVWAYCDTPLLILRCWFNC